MSEQMTHLWRLVENWRESQRFDVTQAALARDIGVARSAVSQWKLGKSTPTPENMRAIQSATGIRYRDLLDALLQDMGYLPPTKESDGSGNAASNTPAGDARDQVAQAGTTVARERQVVSHDPVTHLPDNR